MRRAQGCWIVETLFSSLLFSCFALIGWSGEARATSSAGSWAQLPNNTDVTHGWDVLDGTNQILPGGKGGATHVALLRGKGDSSWVLHWQHGRIARLWLAQPGQLAVMARDVPLPISTTETFCSGHSLMSDGRLIVLGGTLVDGANHVGQTGTVHTVAFDAKKALSGNNWGWSSLDDMAVERWYPTSTTLGSGRVLASSGGTHFNMAAFGGRATTTGSSSALTKEFRPMGRLQNGVWEGDPSLFQDQATAREGHTFTFVDKLGYVVFGGLDASGSLIPGGDQILMLRREGTREKYEWKWQSVTTTPDATLQEWPEGRAWHCAVTMGDSLFIYGGSGEYGIPDGLWLLDQLLTSSPRWKKFTIGNDPSNGPGPDRYSHAGVLDLNRLGSPLPDPLLILFGGGGSTGGLVDNAAWAIRLPRAGGATTAQWQRLIAAGSSGVPVTRLGLVGIADGNPRTKPEVPGVSPEETTRRFFFHGGWSNLQNPSYLSDAWALSRKDGPGDNPTALAWRWNQITFANTPPAARQVHAAIYDHEWDSFRMFGGRLTGGTRTNEQWRFGLGHDVANSDWTWVQVTQTGTPTARSGHAMVEDPREVMSRQFELFDPTAGAAGDWGVLGTGANRYLSWYPMMFQLRSGKVFFAGNGHAEIDTSTSALLDVASQTWSQGPTPSNAISPFKGGSAALYTGLGEHDRVMKCGGIGHIFFEHDAATAHGKTAVATVDTSSLGITWSLKFDMPELEKRHYHNLTILPTGQVLMTGGIDDSNPLDNNLPRKRPRLWDPVTSTWSAQSLQATYPLLEDPERREYHSIALLLPDGRVLSASGDLTPSNPTVFPPAWIYTPPYLLKDKYGVNAVRPVITTVCDSIGYGEILDLSYNGVSSIDQVCIMRPGSVTHALNMDQRRVELGFANSSAGKIRIQMATNPNLVPPGDYLLFLLKDDVPSEAMWVRVKTDVTAPPQPGNLSQDFATDDVIGVSWTAPNGGGTCGRAALYDLRWSASPIYGETEFNSAHAASIGLPQAPGETETAQLNGIAPCTLRYFALKTKDVAGNWSAMETIEGITSCGSCCMLPLMAGGNEEEARTSGSGNALNATESETPVTGPTADSFLRATGFVLEPTKGEGSSWRLRALSAEEARGHGADTTGALLVGIVTKDGTPAFAKLSGLTGRVDVMATLRADRQVIGLGTVAVERIEKSIRIGESGVVSIASAWHSREGDLLGSVRDSGRVDLSVGDTLEIRYAADTSPGAVRTTARHFLSIDAGSTRGSQLKGEQSAPSLPLDFALHQNRPNPFASATTFHFDLPRAERVTLDILDIQGRRVAQVANGRYPAGYHSATWERRSGVGRASPGVYFYRIVAGSFHAKKKLVVLP